MNILFIVKVDILMLIKWSCGLPPNYVDYLSLQWILYYEQAVQSYLNTCLLGFRS